MKGKVVLYGTGKVGRAYYNQMQNMGMSELVCVYCDKNADKIKEIEGLRVVSYDEAKELGLPFIIALSKMEHFKKLEKNWKAII